MRKRRCARSRRRAYARGSRMARRRRRATTRPSTCETCEDLRERWRGLRERRLADVRARVARRGIGGDDARLRAREASSACRSPCMRTTSRAAPAAFSSSRIADSARARHASHSRRVVHARGDSRARRQRRQRQRVALLRAPHRLRAADRRQARRGRRDLSACPSTRRRFRATPTCSRS